MIPAGLQPLANHLWQSTLFAAVAGVLTLAFRRNRAQIRYQLWLVASIKFLVPFSILIAIGSHFGLQNQAGIAPSDFSSVIERAGVPFVASIPVATTTPTQSSNWIPAILSIVWAVGLVVLVLSWWLRWRNIRAVLRTSSPLHLHIDWNVMTSPEFKEPGVFGILRPVLLWPDGLTYLLTPQQLDAILKHELCHVRRRDNLATAIHMLVEAVFWFHPLVWWLGARLIEERERACDEEVLQMGSDPQEYAEGILKICEWSLESPLQCIAGVTGGNLKKRIEIIMTGPPVFMLNLRRKVILAVAGSMAVTAPILMGMMNSPGIGVQAPAAQWQIAAGGKMEFEVASIRQSPPGKFTPPNFPLDSGNAFISGRTNEPPGNRFFADFPVTTYITFAYKLSLTREQRQAMVAGLPKWVDNDRFMIQAKSAKDNPTKDQMRLMMQSLLADRFHLASHFEMQQVPVFALALVKPGKTGPSLRPHAEGPPCDSPTTEPAHASQTPPDIFPAVCELTEFESHGGNNRAGSRNTTMELIASDLPSLGRLGRPVVNGS